METFQIGLASWIIQDGNYADFSVGQDTQFALEFHPYSLTLAQAEKCTVNPIGPARYLIHGRVDFIHAEAWVLDFGLRAYQDRKPPADLSARSWVQGEIYLGVDPFFYFERLRSLPGMPSLSYAWRIRQIKLETT